MTVHTSSSARPAARYGAPCSCHRLSRLDLGLKSELSSLFEVWNRKVNKGYLNNGGRRFSLLSKYLLSHFQRVCNFAKKFLLNKYYGDSAQAQWCQTLAASQRYIWNTSSLLHRVRHPKYQLCNPFSLNRALRSWLH